MDTAESVDQAGVKDWESLRSRIEPRWRHGMMVVLKAKNPELLGKMSTLEEQIQSMILITPKSRPLKKMWQDMLDEYERACNCAVAYASRHLDQNR